MTTEDLFRRIVGALDSAGIAYMLTGSFASSFHGVPRATQDIDFVIAPTAAQIRDLVQQLPGSKYYVDEAAALDALRREGQFNVIDFDTGWKVDLIIRKARPFSLEEFGRRRIVDFDGMKLMIATAEDVLLAKLEWAKLGGSERQIEDAAGILAVRADDIDQDYLARWIDELGLATQWNAANARR